jgi:signal transduction histidine kinase
VFRSIRARLLATYVLTVLGMMIVSGYLVYAFRDYYVSRAREELRAWSAALAHSVREPLASGDRSGVADVVLAFEEGQRSAFGNLPYPQRARITLHVFDASGKLLASSRSARPLVGSGFDLPGIREAATRRQPVEAQLPGMRPGEEYRYIVVPVERGDQLVGILRMAFYPAEFEIGMIRSAVIAALAAALALCTIISLIVARGVARPVKAMSAFAEGIGRGQLGQQLEIRSRDEVGVLADQLNRMSNRLADTDQERREFLAAVSHELRTPVSNVQVTLESLIAGAADEPETRERFLQAALGETHRLGDLIRDLIDLARIEAGVVTMRHREVRLVQIVQRLTAAVESRLGERALALQSEVPPDLHVWADPDRLLQVLMILVDNAAKHAPPGTLIHLGASSNRQEVHIQVRDHGPGVAPEDAPYIFDRFYTADKSRARGATGTGLGLAIARRIVDSHSGTISVHNMPEGGAEFAIMLPRL